MFNLKNATMSDFEIENQVEKILNEMTLKEKVFLLNGVWDPVDNIIKHKTMYNPVPIDTLGSKKYGVLPVRFTDGPRGIAMGSSTCFPVSMARGASFDIDLEKRIGHAMAREARAQGANYFGGVCINLLRHPAWGRAQETYGEDPFLVGEFGLALTEAVQDHNVMACLKHFAVNSIENNRFRVDVKVDERTLHEVYLPHFKKSVDAGAASLMGAYNKINGHYCCESKELLSDILRKQWHFKGFTSSDFSYGIHNTKKAIESGMDLEMPMPVFYHKHLLKAVKDGSISESVIDESARRIIRTSLSFSNTKDPESYSLDMVACKEHISIAQEAAEKSMVLLKNDFNALPIKKQGKLVLVGDLASSENIGDKGSSRVRSKSNINVLEGLKTYLATDMMVEYFSSDQIKEALEASALADHVVIVCGNDYRDEGEYVVPDAHKDVPDNVTFRGYMNQKKFIKAGLVKHHDSKKKKSYTGSLKGEGGDRESLGLKEKEVKLIKAISKININTTVVLVGGSAITTSQWDKDVSSVLMMWYAGMAGGHALARILFGDISPSGKLPFTVPLDEKDLPYFSSSDDEIVYDFYHGYSYFDEHKKKPHYHFGHGLSYTSFKYSNLRLKRFKDHVTVKVDVKNVGKMDVEEVVQVYVGMKDSRVERQEKLLKGFKKVMIEAGQVKTVTIDVKLDELRYYDVDSKNWLLENGSYTFMVGPSSDEETLLKETITLT
ncbi:glycosyl hydrolase [Acidaminobacter sp. JC074]|uniref:beta-glucosidase n=1 Tax=Acidaminobacter sp. JC074 TaxID=2530199 RepID=UPI001F0DE572|nr:glycoside hydrolase family 3 C-terminal domain-containing protein [Acidaminobacter sp. JC074]MCH4890125.1 glycosyl hydrolase [Acidaminobacter sp. JC074]